MHSVDDNRETLEQIQYLIAEGRFAQALELLNAISPYRFTALYRIDGEALHNLVIYDKQSRDQPRLSSMQLGDSYCHYVRESRDAFLVTDSDQDARVATHPKRPTVHAYCGVPILSGAGEVFGTICHFDYDPVDDDGSAAQWLSAVAEIFNPQATAQLLARNVQPRVDALHAMSRLLAETSDTLEEARSTFEEYARPVRAQLERLPQAVVDEMGAKIDGILAGMAALRPQQACPA